MSIEHTTTVGLILDPLDVLFFREGLPFAQGYTAESHLPTPKVLAGAIRTRLMELEGYGPSEFNKLREATLKGGSFSECLSAVGKGEWIGGLQFRGPWLCRFDPSDTTLLDVYTPTPATVHRRKKSSGNETMIERLDPLPEGTAVPGWVPPENLPHLRPLWNGRRAVTEPRGGYLTLKGLKKFLSGHTPSPEEIVDPHDLFDRDRRVGIGVDMERNASEKGFIYGISFLSLRGTIPAESRLEKGVIGLYGEVSFPEKAKTEVIERMQILALGGEGRRVRVSMVERAQWPETNTSGRRTVIVLTTPGLFDCGSNSDPRIPSALEKGLVAASVPGDLPVSGWDLASRGPKPNRFAAVAGSVYFLESNELSIPNYSLCESPDREIGWGSFAKGVW